MSYTWFPSLIGKAIGGVYTTIVYERECEAMLRCEVWVTDGQVFRPETPSVNDHFRVEDLNFVFGHEPLRCEAASCHRSPFPEQLWLISDEKVIY